LVRLAMTQTESIPRAAAIVIGLATLLLVADDLVPDVLPFDTDRASIIAIVTIGLAVVFVLVPPNGLARLKTAAPRIALGIAISVATTAVMLVAGEYLIRWIYRDVTTTGDDRGYFSAKWNAAAVQFNRAGFRERPFQPTKTPGTYRIAVMGDSFTYGNGIAADERFSTLLQRDLGEGFEVLNFGLPGFNTPEVAALLRQQVRGYEPDFILVQWFVNDVEGAGRNRPSYQPLLPSRPHEWLHRNSALYTLVDSWWTRWQVTGHNALSYPEYMKNTFEDPQSPGALDHLGALRAVLNAAGGVPVGFVLFPDFAYDLGTAYPFAFLHQRILDFCAEMSLTCADLRPDFARVANRQSLWASRLDAHPSARANAIAADRIRVTFDPIWLARSR
jgi:hypothetical protein